MYSSTIASHRVSFDLKWECDRAKNRKKRRNELLEKKSTSSNIDAQRKTTHWPKNWESDIVLRFCSQMLWFPLSRRAQFEIIKTFASKSNPIQSIGINSVEDAGKSRHCALYTEHAEYTNDHFLCDSWACVEMFGFFALATSFKVYFLWRWSDYAYLHCCWVAPHTQRLKQCWIRKSSDSKQVQEHRHWNIRIDSQ